MSTVQVCATHPKTNVVVAAFMTAYARVQLYDELDMLQERVLYYDSDPGHLSHSTPSTLERPKSKYAASR